MQIESIDIGYYYYGGFSSVLKDTPVHIKSLQYLSVVQSKVGSYGIKLDDGREYETGKGNFFIAPSICTQKITHYPDKASNLFTSRYIFLDVIINKKYHFDDVFDIPVITDKNTSSVLDRDFDDYESADCICDRMRCLYGIIKHLIDISREKDIYKNLEIYPLTEYIRTNYREVITVRKMADILNMSESNLYAFFRKTVGTSPIKYLNDYRLSVAGELLLQTNETIAEISEKVGIGDQFYFSKLFKSKYTVSPQKYRKSSNSY